MNHARRSFLGMIAGLLGFLGLGKPTTAEELGLTAPQPSPAGPVPPRGIYGQTVKCDPISGFELETTEFTPTGAITPCCPEYDGCCAEPYIVEIEPASECHCPPPSDKVLPHEVANYLGRPDNQVRDLISRNTSVHGGSQVLADAVLIWTDSDGRQRSLIAQDVEVDYSQQITRIAVASDSEIPPDAHHSFKLNLTADQKELLPHSYYYIGGRTQGQVAIRLIQGSNEQTDAFLAQFGQTWPTTPAKLEIRSGKTVIELTHLVLGHVSHITSGRYTRLYHDVRGIFSNMTYTVSTEPSKMELCRTETYDPKESVLSTWKWDVEKGWYMVEASDPCACAELADLETKSQELAKTAEWLKESTRQAVLPKPIDNS